MSSIDFSIKASCICAASLHHELKIVRHSVHSHISRLYPNVCLVVSVSVCVCMGCVYVFFPDFIPFLLRSHYSKSVFVLDANESSKSETNGKTLENDM